MAGRPIGVSLFSGVGGLDLGFEQGGWAIKAAVEFDPVHAAAHKFNFPNCEVIPQSVCDLTGREIRDRSGIKDSPLDILLLSPPCQSFSVGGLRQLDDPRSLLLKECLRLTLELQPSYFILENVKGLTIGKQRKFLDELILAFQENNYEVRLPWRVLQAADFGTPQKRERLFLLGARKGLPLPNYPHPTTKLPGAEGSLPTVATCVEALEDLPEAEDFSQLCDRDWVEVAAPSVMSAYARELRCLSETAWHYGYRRIWNQNLLTSSARTNHSPQVRDRFRAAESGKIERISRFFKLAPNGVVNTIRAGTGADRGSHTAARAIHYRSPRCITVREMARLHGYPDWFRFQVTKWWGARQVGNSVPVPLARALALEIIKCLAIAPTKPKETLELGDPQLLSLTKTQAASYFCQV